MGKILFVCTGNTCRSVMAAAFFNNMIGEDEALCGKYAAFSAGICASEGAPASENTRRVMSVAYGIDVSSHKSHATTEKDMDEALLVLTMTDWHKEQLLLLFPGAADKTFTLSEYVKDRGMGSAKVENGPDFLDPYGMPLEIYLRCAARINESIKKLVPRLGRKRL